MAYQTYRYRWNGITTAYLDARLPPAFPVTFVGVGPKVEIDVSADDSTKDDLDSAMAQRGYVYVAENPVAPTPLTVRQVAATDLVIDAQTVSTAFAALLTLNVTTGAGMLEVYATAASTALVVPGCMRVTLDGAPVADGGAGHLVGMASHALVKRVPVAAGAHVVALEWRTGTGGTLFVRPASNPDDEHATLLVRETF